MKVKTLATAFTVTLPLLFGTAYAQTNTTADTGNNRASDGTSMQTNQSSGAAGTSATQSGAATGATGAAGANTGATGAATGATGAAATGAAGTGSAATGGAGTMAPGAAGTGAAATDATRGAASGATAQGDSVASTEAITGWSAKDDVIGKSVFNENDEKVGDIKDVIISSDGSTLYLMVGAGGFLGMGEKEVAVPFDRFERRDNRVLLSGYTKEQLKALPEVRKER